MLPLIKRNISKVPGWTAQILIYIILFLFMLYILCFFSISVGNIAKTSGLYNFSQNVSPLHQILENFPRDEVNIINTAGIVIMLFLWLLLLGIFKAEKGIVILPFIVDPGDKNSNGNAISEMLIAELKRIIQIHSVNIESNFSSSADMEDLASAKNLSATYPIKDIKEKAHLLQLSPKGENLDQSIQTIGTLAFGSTSIPIGSILIVLRNICPGADPGLIISGCLQKSESDIRLISYMKRENRSWHICQKIKNTKSISDEELSALVSELSYNIYYELLKLQSKQNISDAVGESSGKAPNDNLPSWEVLKYFTEAMDALQTYNITKERKDLECARISGLKAACVDPYYNNPLYLLYNVGIAYINNLNKKDYYEAERLARYIVSLRPDSSRAWYSWGVALKFLTLNNEAIECYDKALFLDAFEKEEKEKIATDIYFMKAISLRDLMHYDEAIMYFLRYFSKKESKENGYAWGHYGITLEAKAKRRVKWDKIPNHGVDEEKLREFLTQRCNYEWAKSIEIEKIDGKTIKLSDKKMVSLKLNNKETEAILEIDNHAVDKFIAKKENNELIIYLLDEELWDKAEEVFRKAIEYQHDFVSVHAALARIYRKRHVLSWEKIPDEVGPDKERIPSEDGLKIKKFVQKNFNVNWLNKAEVKINKDKDKIEITNGQNSLSLELNGDRTNVTLKIIGYETERYAVKKENGELNVYLRDPSKECNEAQKYKQTRKQNEYNRACYEINCGNEDKARELLKTAIKEEQVSRQWLEDDPDWDHVREKQWFKNLPYTESRVDTNERISRMAVRRKLDKESGKDSRLFCEYDIADPKELAEKICGTCDMPSSIVNLKPEEKGNLRSCCYELNTKKILDYLSSDDSLEPYAIREPYSIREIFNEEKVKRSKELQKLLCKILNQYLIDPYYVNANRKRLEKDYPELKAEKILNLSEDAEKALQKESFLVRARFHAACGNVDDALKLLIWALKYEKISKEEVDFEPDFEFIRDKPRFKEIMDKFSGGKRVNS